MSLMTTNKVYPSFSAALYWGLIRYSFLQAFIAPYKDPARNLGYAEK